MQPDKRNRQRRLLNAIRVRTRLTVRRTAATAMVLVESAGRHFAVMANDGAQPE